MRHVTSKKVYLSLMILLMLPVPALAIPAITCHCFSDRSYDPANPAKADPYFLATAQNSFFAAVFTVDKKTVVIKKQTGTSADDLWIAYWIASRSGLSAEGLLQDRSAKESWREVSAQRGLAAKSLGDRFWRELQAGVPSAGLAQAVVDGILLQYHLLGEGDVTAMRTEWAGNQEIILSALIAAKTGRPAKQLYREVKTGTRSWGALLQEAKVSPADIQREIGNLLKKAGH